jgi:citrate lyase subunit beta/citryl-CoA lyase
VQAFAAAGGPPRSIVLPKVESAADVGFVERLLDGVEAQFGRTEPVTIQALIESAAGLARVAEIAGSSPRLRTLILAYADLGASLARTPRGRRRRSPVVRAVTSPRADDPSTGSETT